MIFLDGKPLPEPPTAEELQEALWIDLEDPTQEELEALSSLGLPLPSLERIEELEASSRFSETPSGITLQLFFLKQRERFSETASVLFLLTPRQLISLQREEVPLLRWLREARLFRHPLDLLLLLLERSTDRLADTLEGFYQELDRIGRAIFEERDFEESLRALIAVQDGNDKARLCLLDHQRALSFLARRGEVSREQRRRLEEILRDIDSLLPHNAFLFEKIDFLIDTIRGAINTEQNRIIKIFSVIAVLFMPPTLVASIYGMNFKYMPELSWPWGYPMALGLMLLSALVPYLIFRYKGWL